jgi:hypothetical protein
MCVSLIRFRIAAGSHRPPHRARAILLLCDNDAFLLLSADDTGERKWNPRKASLALHSKNEHRIQHRTAATPVTHIRDLPRKARGEKLPTLRELPQKGKTREKKEEALRRKQIREDADRDLLYGAIWY